MGRAGSERGGGGRPPPSSTDAASTYVDEKWIEGLRQDGAAFELEAHGAYNFPAGPRDGLPASSDEVAFRMRIRGDARGWLRVDVQAEAGADWVKAIDDGWVANVLEK